MMAEQQIPVETPVVPEAEEAVEETPSSDATPEAVIEPVEEAVVENVEPEVVEAVAENVEPEVAAAEPMLVVENVAPTSAEPEPVPAAENEMQVVEAPVSEDAPVEHAAYEEYLKDNNEPVNILQAQSDEQPAPSEASPAAPVTKVDASGEVRMEMDTKNAHAWNELGNVYYNTGAFDDATLAYSKAIELDRGFAWPYSNLALTYVQKNRFAEAILLYQRSIELFTSDKDKAISWNRLGNVYRRMNDYDNAICAYQRADDLDPDNTTLSLQSRFSLLGSFAMEPKPSYAS
jgi:tetratricopeptide (TPR) repeat protein